MKLRTIKYPRTSHLPWSLGATRDDRMLSSVDIFIGKDVVVTEKMDGENSSCYADGYTHARSMDSNNHPSRNWLKQFWAERYFDLPAGYRICGENLYAKHAIHYMDLPTYFMGFSLWEGNECKSWDETMMWFDELKIQSVPVLYRGIFDEHKIKNVLNDLELDSHEGYVIRVTDSFKIDFDDIKHKDEQFSNYIAKYVRKGHVQEDTEHWMTKEIIKNGLR